MLWLGIQSDEDKFAMHGFSANREHWSTLVNLDPDRAQRVRWLYHILLHSDIGSISQYSIQPAR